MCFNSASIYFFDEVMCCVLLYYVVIDVVVVVGVVVIAPVVVVVFIGVVVVVVGGGVGVVVVVFDISATALYVWCCLFCVNCFFPLYFHWHVFLSCLASTQRTTCLRLRRFLTLALPPLPPSPVQAFF